MFAEDDLLPLSALQHLVYCERQCALIHLEQAWSENFFTTKGRHLHERAHAGGSDLRNDVLTVRSLRLRSLHLGLSGQADVVEFLRDESQGVELPCRPGRWRPFPVEYKRGRPKRSRADEVQLCAQALCLKEMLRTNIAAGALYYGQTRRRLEVPFDEALRRETERLAGRLHELFQSRRTPLPIYEKKKCESCSLLELCRPRATQSRHAEVDRWLSLQIQEG